MFFDCFNHPLSADLFLREREKRDPFIKEGQIRTDEEEEDNVSPSPLFFIFIPHLIFVSTKQKTLARGIITRARERERKKI